MLDIKFIIKNRELIKKDIKKRNKLEKIPLIDKLVKLYEEFLILKKQGDFLRHKRNVISKEINHLKKQGVDIKRKVREVKKIPKEIKDVESKIDLMNKEILEVQNQIPNIMHKSVPIGKDNKLLKKWGIIKKPKFKIKNHVELLEKLNQVDFDVSAKMAGNGFYVLKDKIALLNQALIQFSIDFTKKKDYIYIEPPLLLRKNILLAATDIETIKNSIYDIKDEDLSLIGTSEYSLLALHMNQILKKLPKKYFSYTMCFRKEIGAHGINEKGLWRTHQFNKIEQFIFCSPKNSDKYYNEMLKNSEEIMKKLKLPYRVVEICSNELSIWKAKGADIEVYRPTTKKYEEIMSLSNCTDYQARKLNIKMISNKNERIFLHTLNNTALATSRILVAIIENYQQKDGSIKIPTVLQKYTKFKVIK